MLHLGDAAQWLWAILKLVFGTLFGWLDAGLNPVLSPVLSFLNPIFTAVGDAVYAVLSPLPVWLGLTLLSVIAGGFMLVVYRYTSNQAAIGRARDTMTANLLALKLFKEDIRVTFRAQGRLFRALFYWQWLMLRPMFIMVVLLLPVFAQMGTRYQWRPLHPGEQALITVRLKSNPGDVGAAAAELDPSPGLASAVGPVPGGGELVWRVRGGEPGRYELRFHVGGTSLEKELVVGTQFGRTSAVRPGHEWTTQLIHPTERPLPADSPVRAIEIGYAGVDSWIYGANWWILYFFIISMIAAILCLPFIKVRF